MTAPTGGTALNGVIQYLIDNLPAAITTVDPQAIVIEGWPGQADLSDTMVGLGALEGYGEVSTGEVLWVEIGAQKLTERFTVPIYIWAASGDGDQQECRERAFAVYDRVIALIYSDLTLGGQLLNGRVAGFGGTRLQYNVTPDGQPPVNTGRNTVLTVDIIAENHYRPNGL